MGDETPKGNPALCADPSLCDVPAHRRAAAPVTQTTRLSVNGSTSIVITPPLPCGLTGCVAELHITHKHGNTTRVHLDARQRREMVMALGGQIQ
jgi:hypothetical protein